MPIYSGLNGLLSFLSLFEPVKAAVSAGVPTLEDLEDAFLDLAYDVSVLAVQTGFPATPFVSSP
jgi:hypothetical protein